MAHNLLFISTTSCIRPQRQLENDDTALLGVKGKTFIAREMIIRLPYSERLSVPLAGRTLLSSTRRWAEPVLEAHQRLVEFLLKEGDHLCQQSYKTNYSFLKYASGHEPASVTIPLLCSAGLILNWLVGSVVGALSHTSSLAQAEEWFQGGGNSFRLTSRIPEEIQSAVLSPLKNLDYGTHFLDILPYAAEVFETSDEILIAFGASRKSKRATGIFYTPSDVSEYIVETLLSKSRDKMSPIKDITWLDPACGTGCFLLSVLYRVSRTEGFTPGKQTLDFVGKSLYGIDISPIALQSAAYLLVLVSMQGKLSKAGSLQESLFRIGKNLALCDATSLRSSKDLAELYPELTRGADFVVSNPPYIARAKRNTVQTNLFLDANREHKKSGNVYAMFVRMMPSLSEANHGAGGMVVPLSISYNSRQEFHQLRQFMWSKDKWELVHFDRTPDSLFGDDVKTRNTIVFFAHTREKESAISTSELIRWSSRSRDHLFQKTNVSKVSTQFSCTIIPKVGDSIGREMLEEIVRRGPNALGRSLTRVSRSNTTSKSMLRNAGTAYNWLPFEMVGQESAAANDVAKTKYRYWSVPSEEDKAVVFALVQSRLSYWLWRVWGDGFHLTDQFIISLPFSPNTLSLGARESLSRSGEALWKEMLNNKVISLNAGLSSISFCPYVSDHILDDIDQTLTQEYKLPKQAPRYLRDFIKRTIVAGRDDEIHVNPALRKWMTKEGAK